MEIWEITNQTTTLVRDAPLNSRGNTSTTSEYSKILAAKMSNAKADIRAMEAVQNQLDEIRDLQEELTGTVKVDEDSGNANRDEDSGTWTPHTIETVKRYLPDGTIMLTTYTDGKISDRVKLKPHMIVVPDYTAPPKPDGSVATELKPTNNFYPAMLMI